MKVLLLFMVSILLSFPSVGQLENPFQRHNGLVSYSLFDQQVSENYNHWVSSPSIPVHHANCSSIAPSYPLNLPQAVSLTPPNQQFGQAVLMLGLNLLSRGRMAPAVYPGKQPYYPRTPD